MADLVNPYSNPYLPSFVSQRPKVMEPQSMPTPQMTYSGVSYSQIHSVKGFEGARAYSLANGASEILAEDDPNLARVYIVAKDANGQTYLQGFDLIPVIEPKPITMDDLSSTMNQILERLNKLEGDRNEQSVSGNVWKGDKRTNDAGARTGNRNGPNGSEPSAVSKGNDARQ